MLDEAATEPAHAPAPIVVLDCRWLGIGGAGRVTELLLAGLRDAPPSGTWLLWGDPQRIARALGGDPESGPAAEGAAPWRGARTIAWRGDPTGLFGQRDLLHVPAGDVVVYLHQIRPLRPGRSVTVVHDTIPLRYGGSRRARALKGLFLRVAARLSDRIVTVSAASRDAIVRDLGVASSRVIVTSLGVDPGRVARIRALRAAMPAAAAPAAEAVQIADAAARSEAPLPQAPDFALYVGRFAEHKNLRRLCRAFAVTAFAASGGRLALVGGTPAEAADLTAWARDEGLACVDVRTACPEEELDRLLASCRALVQPSLEEGYGLPAVEAAAVGIQVAASPAGAAPTIPTDRLTRMDPRDEASIARAIDAATSRPDPAADWSPVPTVAVDVVHALTATTAASHPPVRPGS